MTWKLTENGHAFEKEEQILCYPQISTSARVAYRRKSNSGSTLSEAEWTQGNSLRPVGY